MLSTKHIIVFVILACAAIVNSHNTIILTNYLIFLLFTYLIFWCGLGTLRYTIELDDQYC